MARQNTLEFLEKSSIFNILSGVVFLFLAAQISIPLHPVPITLQTLAVTIIGLTFNRDDALKAIGLYLFLGFAGLPIFADFTGGIIKLYGPTSGYLFGFLFAIYAMTTLNRFLDQERLTHLLFSGTVGTIIIYLFGTGRLSYLIGFDKAFQLGLLPFIYSGVVKIILSSIIIRYLKSGKLI